MCKIKPHCKWICTCVIVCLLVMVLFWIPMSTACMRSGEVYWMKCGPWSKDCSISFEILKINIEKFFFIHFYNIIILLQFFPIKKTIVSHYCYKYWKKINLNYIYNVQFFNSKFKFLWLCPNTWNKTFNNTFLSRKFEMHSMKWWAPHIPVHSKD